MFSFVSRLLAFAGIQGLLVYLLCMNTPKPPSQLSVINQKLQILEAAPRPRMIIEGGSSVMFAYDGASLYEATGYYPVSVGMYAGLGIDYFMSEGEDLAKPGDIVLLSLEPNHYVVSDLLPLTAAGLIVEHPSSIKHIRLKWMPRVLDLALGDIVEHLFQRTRYLRGHQPPANWLFDLDQYGFVRITAPPRKPYRGLDVGKSIHDPQYVDSVIDRMNAFVKRCRAKGAEVVLTFSPYDGALLEVDREHMDATYKRLQERFEGILLGSFERSAQPAEFFRDSSNHVNMEGRMAQTKVFLEEWKKLNIPRPAGSSPPPPKPAD